MKLTSREYRSYLYERRNHPETLPPGFVDNRESNFQFYLSLIFFVAAEYLYELGTMRAPSGLLFPLGFILYWAFYYTFYKPDVLENKLSTPSQWRLSDIPALAVGVVIWFFKATIKEIIAPFLKKPAKPRTPALRVIPTPIPKRESKPRLPKEILDALHLLGLGPDADWKAIQHQFRFLAKKHHPDLNQEITKAGRHFMAIDAAYRRLQAVRKFYFD